MDLEEDYLRDLKQKEMSNLLEEFDTMIADTKVEYLDISITAREIFMSDYNFNNGDITSGQYIFSEDEITKEILKIKNFYQKERVKTDLYGVD